MVEWKRLVALFTNGGVPEGGLTQSLLKRVNTRFTVLQCMLKKRSDKFPKNVCRRKLCCTHRDEKTDRETEIERERDRQRET